MKKQLLNELEKEAPFRQSLKEDIIKEANRSARKQMSWKIWTAAGTVVFALTVFLLMNLNDPKLNQSESAINAEQKVADIIEEIDSIEGSKLNGRFFQLSSDEQLFLISIYNSNNWEPIGEDQVPYKELELSVTRGTFIEPQPLVILYRKEQTYTTLYSSKGKLTLKGDQVDYYNEIIKDAFSYKGVEKAMNINAILAFQPQQRLTQNDPEKVSKLKEILHEGIYSTGTVIDTKDYPDGYIDLFTTSDSKYRLNYWVKQNKVVIEEGISVGELTGDTMYKFIQFIIEEGEYKKGVRVVTKNEAERLQSRIEKIEDLPSNFYKENFQRPNYILDVNGKVYFLTIFDDSTQMITDSSMAYTLSDFEDEINTLLEKSRAELNSFMQERTWEKGKMKMIGLPDFTFRWNGQMYQVWINGGTMIGRVNDESVWEDLTEKEVEMLEQLVRELQ